MINIDIYTESELAEISELSIKESRDLFGKHEFALVFSDHPDYGFIRDVDNMEKTIISWLKELNLLEKEPNF